MQLSPRFLERKMSETLRRSAPSSPRSTPLSRKSSSFPISTSPRRASASANGSRREPHSTICWSSPSLWFARPDGEWMGRLYKALGLTVGVIVHDLSDQERKVSYNCDITYGTNNEYGFDYLRDNMKFRLEDCAQRSHNYAIVDEVDSILIDEARTPLIISGPSEESTDKYYKINRIIPKLIKGEVHEGKEPGEKWTTGDYTVDEKHRSVGLTEQGVSKVEKLLNIENLYDPAMIEINHHVQQSLRAHVLYLRDREYVVKDDQVIIVDEFTGRLMPGRRWSDGLHQAVEAKEGVKIERENQTLATITFQNYFRLY